MNVLVSRLLSHVLHPLGVYHIPADSVSVCVWTGQVEVRNVRLVPKTYTHQNTHTRNGTNAFNAKYTNTHTTTGSAHGNIALRVVHGTIGCVSVNIPWLHLRSESVRVCVRDVDIWLQLVNVSLSLSLYVCVCVLRFERLLFVVCV